MCSKAVPGLNATAPLHAASNAGPLLDSCCKTWEVAGVLLLVGCLLICHHNAAQFTVFKPTVKLALHQRPCFMAVVCHHEVQEGRMAHDLQMQSSNIVPPVVVTYSVELSICSRTFLLVHPAVP